jgi:L-ascorbate metabolism protein UlaG (beta-lactamase superfamily)
VPLTITYLSHSAFLLEADGKSVLVDPFLTGNDLAARNPDDLNPTTIIITHAHNDHVGDTLDIAMRTGAQVIATFELVEWLKSQGVENGSAANHGGTVAFDGGSTKLTPAWHTSSYQTDRGFVAPGLPAGHVIRFGGKTTYFSGDTALFMDMQLIAEEGLDIAILPIGDNFTMGPKDAAKAAAWLGAPTVIPCHFNTFPPIEQDPRAFKEDVEANTSSSVVILAPGNSREFE